MSDFRDVRRMKAEERRRREERVFWVKTGLLALLTVLIVSYGVWAHFFAPCSQIDWLPVKDLPSRCLTLVR